MTFPNRMRHFWFAELDATKIVGLAIKRCRGPVVVFANRTTRFASILAWALNVRVQPANLTMAFEDPTGRNLTARAEELCSQLRAHLISNPGDYEWLPKSQREFGPEWQRVLAAHLFEQNITAARTLAYIEARYLNDPVGQPAVDEIIVHLGRHGMACRVGGFNPGLGLGMPVRIVSEGDGVLGMVLTTLVRIMWRPLRMEALKRFRRSPEQHCPAPDKGTILVQFEKTMPDRWPLGATYDWIESSGIQPERIIFYFSRQDSPLDAKVRKKLTGLGFGWAEYYYPDTYMDRPIRTIFRLFKDCAPQLKGVNDSYSLWRWCTVLSALYLVEAHRQFIRRFNVISIHQHMEFLPYATIQSLAARQEGAIFVWGFWSVIPFLLTWYDHALADLIQCWGEFDLGMVNTLGFDYRYAIIAGSLGYDGARPDDDAKAAEIRRQLRGTPRFVITVFDNSHIKVGLGCYNSTERCAEFYRVILNLLLENPDWGCLIKSKNSDLRDFDEHTDLQEKFDILHEQGRAIILPVPTSPSLALRAGDVSYCFPINSAGLLAQLNTGRPTIHFDLTRMSMHPLSHAGGDGKIIFRDADGVTRALHSIARGEGLYGDLAQWRDILDPFRDGMGRTRSGRVMGDYVLARDRGLDAAQALREAVQSYADVYGDAFVSTRMSPHVSAGDRLWQDVGQVHYPHRAEPPAFSRAAMSAAPIQSAASDRTGTA